VQCREKVAAKYYKYSSPHLNSVSTLSVKLISSYLRKMLENVGRQYLLIYSSVCCSCRRKNILWLQQTMKFVLELKQSDVDKPPVSGADANAM